MTKTPTRVIGFDSEEVSGSTNDARATTPPLVLKPDQVGYLLIHPQTLFRVDRLYFETEGLIIESVKVGRQPQGIDGTPSSYYKERDEEDLLKGRPIRFDTCEVGMLITFELKNVNTVEVIVRGCVEGGCIS